MKEQFVQYTKALVIFSVLIFALIILAKTFIIRYVSPTLPLLILFFVIVSLIVYYYLLKSTRYRFATFSRNFMLVTTIKLFFYLSILVAYALLVPKDAVNFIIGFFVLYISFSAFEIYWLLRIRNIE
jgi:hypothetical protein